MPTPLARELRRLMTLHGISMLRLSNSVGVGESYIRDILRGRSIDPRRGNLEKVAAVFGKTAEELLHPRDNGDDPLPQQGTRPDLLQLAYTLSERILRGHVSDKEAATHRIAAVIYDTLVEREVNGSPISSNDEQAVKLMESLIRRMLREMK